MPLQRALGEVAVLPLPCVSMASPVVVPPDVEHAGDGYWFRAIISMTLALSDAGAVRAALLVAVRRRSEPVPALRALPLDHTGWWFPCLRVDGTGGCVVQRFVDQWRLLLVGYEAPAGAPASCSMPCLAATAAPNRARARSSGAVGIACRCMYRIKNILILCSGLIFGLGRKPAAIGGFRVAEHVGVGRADHPPSPADAAEQVGAAFADCG